MSEREQDRGPRRSADLLAGVLMLGANTAHVIDWPQLRKALAAAPPGLTPEARVRLLLGIANRGRATAAEVNQIVGMRVIGGTAAGEAALPPPWHAWVVERLTVLTEGSAPQRKALVERIAATVDGSVAVFRVAARHGAQAERIVAASLEAGIAYAFLLLVDARLPFARRLHRCPYSRCRKFFLLSPARGAPRRHCTAEHGRLADNERAADRMRRKRRSGR